MNRKYLLKYLKMMLSLTIRDKILLASLGRDLMEQQYKGTQMPQMDTDCFNVNAHYEPLIIR